MVAQEKIEFRYSHWRMASLLISSLGFVALGIAMIIGAIPGAGGGSFREFIAYVCILLFGGAAIVIGRQWLGNSGPVVTFTDKGVTDTRIAKEEIPWSAVQNLAMWQYGRQKSLVLTLDPEVEAGLSLTRIARWTRGPNKSLGVDGLCIASAGLNTSFDNMMQQATLRYQASRAARHAALPPHMDCAT